MSLTLSDLSLYGRPAYGASYQPAAAAPASETQRAQSAQSASTPAGGDSADADGAHDPYAQIDSLLASLRDLTLGGAKLDSASTTSQANAAYAAYAMG
ncbi:hypothetical protein EDE12_101415 [Methylosinus sp. sav-2]|uniref:hypothetical protein n=1 Tax=Methylosinus sp. sav-2 TaxID=2485168 RepID=UPI00047CE00B|nr:hypothetical protein [Methylosinus sp. sav-2]TDX66877.1 hypothetical protein EDE12_101415 [Methylosinus sp. sav-2]